MNSESRWVVVFILAIVSVSVCLADTPLGNRVTKVIGGMLGYDPHTEDWRTVRVSNNGHLGTQADQHAGFVAISTPTLTIYASFATASIGTLPSGLTKLFLRSDGDFIIGGDDLSSGTNPIGVPVPAYTTYEVDGISSTTPNIHLVASGTGYVTVKLCGMGVTK